MVTTNSKGVKQPTLPFYIRKLGQRGKARSMSVGKMLPGDWVAVKVTVEKLSEGVCELRIEQIK